MTANRKIKNATPTEYNDIQFKSKTEVMVYKTLLQYGFKPCYEPTKYGVWRGFKPTVPTYKPDKTGQLKLEDKKIIDITYTPDFIFMAPDNKTVIIMEAKGGFLNDTYPIKEKLFRGYLEDLLKTVKQPTMFFQVRSKSQVIQAINIIKEKFKDEQSKN
jgi:hypothetical protein